MNRKLLIPLVLIFIGVNLSSQDQKWSVEASYPVSVGTEFATDGRGLIDLGVNYRFTEVGRFQLGASFNTSLFTSRTQFTAGSANEDLEYDFRESNVFLQPRLFIETNTPGLEVLRWSLGLGYSWELYKAKGTFMNEPLDSSDTEGGFNVNVGASLDVYRN